MGIGSLSAPRSVARLSFVIVAISAVVLLGWLRAPRLAGAHPGNTASDGCHYCRTNCDRWGVPWNQRHCHNSGNPPPAVPTPAAPPPPPTDPIGRLERITYGPAGVGVAGWMIDPDTIGSIQAHVYIDGVGVGVTTASQPRPDVASAFPGYGPAHGFGATVPIGGGTHIVCVYGVNVGPGSSAAVGCTGFTTPTEPFGSVDSVSVRYDRIRVRGWAIDPNTTSPVSVHVYVDGAPRAAITASGPRHGVGSGYPIYGPAHGFDVSVLQLSSGTHNVCVYAINRAPGTSNPAIGCRVVQTSGDPIGAVDAASAAAVGGINFRGWAFDPNSTDPITIRAYVDGMHELSVDTGLPRPSVDAAHPGAGPSTGFRGQVLTTPGRHTLCLYAIDIGNGNNSTLGCRSVNVPG